MEPKKSRSQILNILTIIFVTIGVVVDLLYVRYVGILITSFGVVFGVVSLVDKQKHSKWIFLFAIISWLTLIAIIVYDLIVVDKWGIFSF
jgi:hypothetical protein